MGATPDDGARGIIRLEFHGWIQPSDYQEQVPKLEALMRSVEAPRCLFDWTDLAGWSEPADPQRSLFRELRHGQVARIAILGGSRWRAEAARLERLIGTPVRLFDSKDASQAMSWLQLPACPDRRLVPTITDR